MSIKSFTNYVNSLNEAVAWDKLNSRVIVTDARFQAEFNLRVPADEIIGVVSFGSSTFPRTIIVDKNLAYDQQLARTIYVGRIQNSLTTYESGYVQNATLAKFDLEKGTMWLAEDDNEDGSISWGRGFKFKMMNLSQEVAQAKGWIR